MATGTRIERPLRWGILGAARIARNRFVPALGSLHSGAQAVAASSARRALEFARETGIPRAYGDYAELIDDPEIDAVYIALANGAHTEWALRAAAAGKHCLCEKPMALSAADASEMARAFWRSQKLLVEAFMWRHHYQVAFVLDAICSGRIGALRTIEAGFAFTLDRPDDYRWEPDQGGGALRDLGCYAVNAARLFFGSEPIEGRLVRQTRLKGGVDVTSGGMLSFPEGGILTFTCSFDSYPSQGLVITGTHGRITMETPWAKPEKSGRVSVECPNGVEDRAFQANSYELMIKYFTNVARGEFATGIAEDGEAQAKAMELLFQDASSKDDPENRP